MLPLLKRSTGILLLLGCIALFHLTTCHETHYHSTLLGDENFDYLAGSQEADEQEEDGYPSYICPNVKRPKFGALTCTQGNGHSECTIKCIPGYVFRGTRGKSELKINCDKGHLPPNYNTPPCESTNQCAVKMTGGGYYNCSMGMKGTKCIIRCTGNERSVGQYNCYPGKGWNPPLPKCVTPKGKKSNSRVKRQYYSGPGTHRSVCPELKPPKFGSISCIQVDRHSECTSRCLPGYIFRGAPEKEEITLVCYAGSWSPEGSFPRCESTNQCALQMTGSGSFNCTTGMDGTRCDIRCSGREIIADRYFCYPGRDWEPPLPHCITRKMSPIEMRDQNQAECHCLNGGTCNHDGSCICPPRRSGTFCERLTRPKCHCRYGGTCDIDGECICPPGRTGNFCERIDRPECRCRNGGRCDPDGKCVCPFETSGTYCEKINTPQCDCKNGGRCVDGYCMCPPRYHGLSCEEGSREEECADPGFVPNSERMHGDGSPAYRSQRFSVTDSVVFSCYPSFALQGSSLLTCLSSGTWSANLPQCSAVAESKPRTCPDPGQTPNADRLNTDGSLSLGSQIYRGGNSVVYTCRSGYALHGSSLLTCLSTGQWSNERPECTNVNMVATRVTTPSSFDNMVYCDDPGNAVNGQKILMRALNERRRPSAEDEELYPEGTRFRFLCDRGFNMIGDEYLTCLQTGFWSTEPPVCVKSEPIFYCNDPGQAANAQRTVLRGLNERRRPSDEERYPDGTRFRFACDRGFNMRGPEYITCLQTGVWSSDLPVCISSDSSTDLVYCDDPGQTAHGRRTLLRALNERRRPSDDDIDDTEFPDGTRFRFACDTGYNLVGPEQIVCKSSGFWSDDPPTCTGECGFSMIQSSRRITHGNKTIAGEWPWTVAIGRLTGNMSLIICGGALINSRTIVTAAHCFATRDLKVYKLYFGKYHRSDSLDDSLVQTRKLTRILIHPNYNRTEMDSDIALVRFAPSVKFGIRIQPICLPTVKTTAANIVQGNKGYV